VVRVFDLGADDDVCFITMAWRGASSFAPWRARPSTRSYRLSALVRR
jgi:hypothetical protein